VLTADDQMSFATAALTTKTFLLPQKRSIVHPLSSWGAAKKALAAHRS
jgi:hypothetical protein